MTKAKRLLSVEVIRARKGEPVYLVDSYSKTERWEIIKDIESDAEGERLICESGLHYDMAKYGMLEGWTAYEVSDGLCSVDMRPCVRKAKDWPRYAHEKKGQRVLVIKVGHHILIREDTIHSFIKPDDVGSGYVRMFSGDTYPLYSYGETWTAHELITLPPDTQPQPPKHETGDTKRCPKCGCCHFTYSEVFKSWACMDCGHVEHEECPC